MVPSHHVPPWSTRQCTWYMARGVFTIHSRPCTVCIGDLIMVGHANLARATFEPRRASLFLSLSHTHKHTHTHTHTQTHTHTISFSLSRCLSLSLYRPLSLSGHSRPLASKTQSRSNLSLDVMARAFLQRIAGYSRYHNA